MNATSTILPPIPDLITGQRILARLRHVYGAYE